MLLTRKLFGWVYRAISPDPLQFLALRLRCDGPDLTWTVADGVLTTAPSGGTAAPLSLPLANYTLAGLVAALAAAPGYTVLYVDPDRGNLSARVLLDGTGTASLSNGDHLYGYTSLAWAYFEAVAGELAVAQAQIAALPAEMVTSTADGYWLDLLGSYYAVPRQQGEPDAQYGPRIIATILQPKQNNVAMEIAIQAAISQPATVSDVTIYQGPSPTFNGAITFNGGSHFNATNSTPVYGLFDVLVGYDILGSGNPTAFVASIKVIVESLRAAGTHLRSVVLGGAVLTDAGRPVNSEIMRPWVVTGAYSDAPDPPSDTSSLMPVTWQDSDTVAAATEASALSVTYATTFNGVRRFSGASLFNAGAVVAGTLES
jgi:hypothetical protein